ncbi:peptidase M24, structural domain-containing protein [Obelidium mucronatum]|nr:peptidase M24, structural domain-containing protein [Obelidium mucronatum]
MSAMHKQCRDKVFAGMKEAGVLSGVALLKGGEPSFRHDTDHEHLFRQESHFFYLFGINEPDLFGMLDFVHWSLTRYAAKYGVDQVHFVDELSQVVEATKASTIHILSGVNSDSKRAIVKVDVGSVLKTLDVAVDESLFYKVMVDSRAVKTSLELDLMRHVNTLASLAHIHVMKNCKPGLMEFQLESLFLGYASFEGGCRYSAYTCICGCGPNGAILHYGHAGAPNDKKINDGDIYPSNGKFTQKQRGIYNAVLSALVAVRNAVHEGVEWVDMHLLAERKIVEALVEIGIIQLNGKTLDEVLELEIGALFFPHVPAVDDPVKGAHLNKQLILDEYMNFGGVRLEEDLIITVDGCENMTNVPRDIEDIEAVMAGGETQLPGGVSSAFVADAKTFWTKETRTSTVTTNHHF